MKVFVVDAIGTKSVTFTLAVILIPAVIVFVSLWLTQGKNSFVGWMVLAISICVGVGLLAQIGAVGASIDGGALSVGGGLYKVSVEGTAIRKEEVRAISELERAQFLNFRTNGVGMPGLALGWFKSRDQKRYFALATGDQPILVPTTLGYDIVVSPSDGEGFMAAVREM